jgi:hypothetical protein
VRDTNDALFNAIGGCTLSFKGTIKNAKFNEVVVPGALTGLPFGVRLQAWYSFDVDDLKVTISDHYDFPPGENFLVPLNERLHLGNEQYRSAWFLERQFSGARYPGYGYEFTFTKSYKNCTISGRG